MKADTVDTQKNLSQYNVYTDTTTGKSYVWDGNGNSEPQPITPKN